MPLQINDVIARIKQAQAEYESACANANPDERHTALRLAYGNLSQAASDAYMYYASNPKTGNFAEGGLSTWARDELEVITRTIGAQYCTQGLVPTNRMQAEYDMWSDRVRLFVHKLSSSQQLDAGQVAAKDWKEDELRRKRKQAEEFGKHMFDRTGVVGGGF